jgi:photosystem II stability/assembly factor-like uncharacterized protein
MGDGIYKSTDGGQNWKNMGLPSNLTELVLLSLIQRIAILFGLVFLPCGDSDERGVYKTTDGGTTWNKVLCR